MELHFHAFESVFYLDTKCFERSLAGRRDATLFVYGQYCRFIRRLCHRAILPKCTPDDAEWTKLLQLCPDDLKQLSSRDFLSRLKLETDFDQACRAKIKRHQDDKKPGQPSLDALAAKERENFGIEARGYIVSLLEALLRNVHFTANIVHGMGCFDPHVLLSLPLIQVTFCFDSLYDSFRVRGWVDEASKSECRDEYFEIVDYLRSAYSSMKNSPGTIPDMLDFLVPMPAFQSRSRLFHLFKLCCICITEDHHDLPAVKFQDVDTSSLNCRLSAVILPAQSYLANCPDAIAVCTTESALTAYKELSDQFNSCQFAGDRWSHVDVFGRAHFLKTLTTAYKNLKGVPTAVVATTSRSSSVSSSAVRKINWAAGKAQELAYFGDIPPSEISKTVKELRQGSSKD